MAVSTTNAISGPFTTNGVTTVFPFTFTAPSAGEVSVFLRDDSVDTPVSTSAYSVSLNPGGGGSVTFGSAPTSGFDLYIALEPSFTQDIQFEDGSAWLASPVNNANDRAAARDQYLKARIDAVVPDRALAGGAAGKFLAFDAGGNPVVSTGTGADSGLRDDLATTGGSSLLGFIQAGIGAVAISVLSFLRLIVHVRQYGAVADGVTDASAAIIAACAAHPGERIRLGKGTYLLNSSLGTLPQGTRLVGASRSGTALKKNFNGDVAALDLDCAISDLTVDGNATASKTGRGFVISEGSSSGTGRQSLERVRILDMDGYCVEWTDNAAGWGGGLTECDVQRAGNLLPCLKFPDTEVNGNRVLRRVFAGSGTLVDIAGGANIQISDCTSGSGAGPVPAFTMGTSSAKVQFTNNRFATGGGTTQLLGQNHTFSGNSHAGPFELGSGVADSLTNSYGTGNDFAGYAITDQANAATGSENKFDLPKAGFTPVWTAATSAPSVGNGELVSNYAREGNTVIYEIELTAGSTTTFGTGLWSFSLPVKNNDRVAVGNVWMFDVSGSAVSIGTAISERGMTTLSVYPHAAAGAQSNSPFTWADGDKLRLSMSYIGA